VSLGRLGLVGLVDVLVSLAEVQVGVAIVDQAIDPVTVGRRHGGGKCRMADPPLRLCSGCVARAALTCVNGRRRYGGSRLRSLCVESCPSAGP